MTHDDIKAAVDAMLKSATGTSTRSEDALRFSQAALNAANAWRVLNPEVFPQHA
jgi:hypothetical protein